MEKNYLLYVVSLFMRLHGNKAAYKDIAQQLYSDGAFPSMVSLIRTMSFFGVESNAYEVTKDKICTLKDVIVHTQQNGGHFYVLTSWIGDTAILYDGETHRIPLSKFLKECDGRIISAESKKITGKTFFPNLDIIDWCFIALILYLVCEVASLRFICSVYSALNIIALSISYLLMRQGQLGFINLPFCRIGHKVNCKEVAASSPIDFIQFKPYHMGLFYFSMTVIFCLLSPRGNIISVITSALGLLFCAYLLGYQIWAVRKYCLYCIVMTTVVCANLTFSIWTMSDSFPLVNFLRAIFISIVLAVTMANSSEMEVKMFNTEILFLRFKRNPIVFSCLQSMDAVEFPKGINGLRFGNKKASKQITLLVDTSCKYCRKTISQAIEIMEAYPQRFGLNLILCGVFSPEMLPKEFRNKNLVHLSIYEVYKDSPNKLLRYLKKIKSIPRLEHVTFREDYYELQKELSRISISRLPMVFVDGKHLPSEYSIADLGNMI